MMSTSGSDIIIFSIMYTRHPAKHVLLLDDRVTLSNIHGEEPPLPIATFVAIESVPDQPTLTKAC